MSATSARIAVIDAALHCLVSERAEPSATSDAQNEYDEERLDRAARNLVAELDKGREER